MKALVKQERAPGLTMADVPMPQVGHNDLLIKITKTAICGTDVHIWNWDEWSQRTIPVPMHVGHEYVGVVAGMGSPVPLLNIWLFRHLMPLNCQMISPMIWRRFLTRLAMRYTLRCHLIWWVRMF